MSLKRGEKVSMSGFPGLNHPVKCPRRSFHTTLAELTHSPPFSTLHWTPFIFLICKKRVKMVFHPFSLTWMSLECSLLSSLSRVKSFTRQTKKKSFFKTEKKVSKNYFHHFNFRGSILTKLPKNNNKILKM